MDGGGMGWLFLGAILVTGSCFLGLTYLTRVWSEMRLEGLSFMVLGVTAGEFGDSFCSTPSASCSAGCLGHVRSLPDSRAVHQGRSVRSR